MCRTQTILTVMLYAQNTDNSHRHVVCAEHRQFSPSCCMRRTQTVLTVMLCVQNTDKQNTDNSHRLVVSTEIILCVQDTDSSHRYVVCAEHRQFQRSRCVCRTQTFLTVILRVQNTDKQNTDNSHRLVVSTENRRFSPSSCVCSTQTNRTQTILTVMCAQNTNGTQTILSVMLCVQNTDKQNRDNCHRQVVCAEYKQNTNNSHDHFVCAEHRQFSPSSCVCRTQTNRTQTILTVILCVQNTVGRWCGHVHQLCRRLRVVTVAPAQSAVPAQSVTLLPIGQSVLTHHVLSGTRMDRG